MIRRLRIISVLGVMILLVMSGCSGGERTVTDPAEPIEVEAGDEFTIVVNSNPTTGYEWLLIDGLPDDGVVVVVSKVYEGDEPVTTGSGGVDIWTFRAVAAGETEISLGHFPPDGSDVPQTVNRYSVVVR